MNIACEYDFGSFASTCNNGFYFVWREVLCFINDEVQNLTPHEIKTIITRAGEGTKIVFTGDIHQIDSPYLDMQSNGLVYMIDRMKGQDIFAHVNLIKGERSELSELASNLL